MKTSTIFLLISIIICILVIVIGYISATKHGKWEKDMEKKHDEIIKEQNITKFKQKCSEMYENLKNKNDFDLYHDNSKYVDTLFSIKNSNITQDNIILYKILLSENAKFIQDTYGKYTVLVFIGTLFTICFYAVLVSDDEEN